MAAAKLAAIGVAIFIPVFLPFFLSCFQSKAERDRAQKRRIAEHGMNARLLSFNLG